MSSPPSRRKLEWDNTAILRIGTERLVYPSAELAPRPASPRDRRGTNCSTAPGAFTDRCAPPGWQMHGFDIPLYTNIIYPSPQSVNEHPHPLCEFNPVGSYP